MTIANTDVVVDIASLSKTFARHAGWRGLLTKETRAALTEVTLQVPRGEVFGLLGPNGAGKTTLLKILATLVLPTSGRASVMGLDVTTHADQVREHLGVVYGDERSFFWRLSVRENLRFYAALYGLTGRDALHRVDELIDLVGLNEAANVRMYSFSTGMKQRSAIARGLLGDPSLVLMDEPTRSLDPIGTADIHAIIMDRLVADRKHTVVLATNNMREAESLCRQVVLIDRGQVQLVGTIDELRGSFFGTRICQLVVEGLAPGLPSELERLPGVRAVDLASLPDSRVRITMQVDPTAAVVPKAVRLLVNGGASVWSCTEESVSLEDLFRSAVGRSSAPTPAGAAEC